MNSIHNDNNNEVIKFSHKTVLGIAVLFLALGSTIMFIPKDDSKPLIILASVITTIGSTLLAVGIINIFYERWKDKELKKQLNSIPKHVKNEIMISIDEITNNAIAHYESAHPKKIYPPRKNDELDNSKGLVNQLSELETDLMEDVIKSDKYNYVGIGMSSISSFISDIIESKGEFNMFFIIPNPNIVSPREKKTMQNSVKTIVNAWKSNTSVKLEFVFLDFLPSFHIHLTASNAWFAFIDKPANKETQRQVYPATYWYKKNNENSDDSYEMYWTIHKILEDMKARHIEANPHYSFNNHHGTNIVKERIRNRRRDNKIERTIGIIEFLNKFE